MISKRLPIILSSIHLPLFVITILSGGRYGNPFFCVDIPISLPLVASDNTPTITVVGILGTAWWYFIGQIGWSAKQGRISRMGCGLGAFLILLICAIDSFAMVGESFAILRAPESSIVDVAIYFIAVPLLAGGIISGVLAAKGAFQSGGR